MEQKASAQSQTYAQEAANNDSSNQQEIITREQYKDTVIYIITTNKDGEGVKSFAAVGKYRITEKFANKHDLIAMLDNKDYNIITTMIDAIVQVSLELHLTQLRLDKP